eukprot:scaffold3926_cov26-Cyclotella_meneghiniana.AAC.3
MVWQWQVDSAWRFVSLAGQTCKQAVYSGDGKKHYKSDNGEGDDDDDGTTSSNPLMILEDFKFLMDRCGFRCTHVDQSNKMFLFMDFVKVKGSSGLSKKESFSAKPCNIYKRRLSV